MRTPNPKALVPGAVVIAVLLVAVIALVAASGGGDDSATSTTSAGAPPPTITLDREAAEPKLTARERAGARRDQARERAEHGAPDEPDESAVADAPVTTVDTTHGAGALLAALPATTPDGWRLEVQRLDAQTGITYLTAAPVNGHPTTTRAATAAVRRAARSLGDDPNSYRTTVPRSLLTTTERTTR